MSETIPTADRHSSISKRDLSAGEKELARHFRYLDRLRESGRTNMFGAAPYLQAAHGLSIAKARVVLQQWMSSFNPDIEPIERARAAISKATGA